MKRGVTLETNRDLYEHVVGLRRAHPTPRPLDEYLRALATLALPYRHAPLTLADVGNLIEQAFTAPASPYDARWPAALDEPEPPAGSYAAWLRTVRRQVVDLVEMQAAGTLADEQRYFGVNSPRGERWYNFDPHGFLECGVQGSVGGWHPGDATGRIRVPGKVAVLDQDGKLHAVDPAEIDDPVFAIEAVSWGDFERLLLAGQLYE